MSAPTRVLVIDDEKGLRDMLTHTFRRMSFEVGVAEDGEKGVAAALAGEFDVVVCDVMMPGMGGMAVLEILKRERPALEVILVSGFPTDESSTRARQLGAFEYLAKPYDLMALCAALEAAVVHKRERGRQ